MKLKELKKLLEKYKYRRGMSVVESDMDKNDAKIEVIEALIKSVKKKKK